MIENTPTTLEEDVFVFPASFAQKRLWFLDQWEPGSYNIPTAVRLMGQMDVAAMENGLKEIVCRHEVLRTTFKFVDGNLVQIIAPHMPFSMPVIDLQGFSSEIQKAKMRRLVREDTQNPFDLRNGPLLRASMLKLSEQEHVLLVTMHHIISDAWSMGVFFHELAALYTANVYGQPSPLSELPIQYVDYAIWQHDWLQGEVLETQLAYWRRQLADLPVLQLPIDRTRPAIQTFRGANYLVMLPRSLTDALKALCRRERVTLFMALLAAFQALLFRYTNQEDIAVAIPIAGRTESNLEGLIGCFINTLALRTNLAGNPTFRELLARVREVALGAYAHQDLPFEKLVEELQPERDLSRNTLTQVMFALQNVPQEQLSLPGLVLSPLKLDSETAMLSGGDVRALVSKQQNLMYDNEPAMFDLDLMMWERGNEVLGEFKYNTDLFDGPTIKRMQNHFLTLLESIVADPDQHIADLCILSEDEQYQMLIEWNATKTDYADCRGPQRSEAERVSRLRGPSEGECFHQLFEAQVGQTPDAIAVSCEGHHLTYRELNHRANRLAAYLRNVGVGPETLVPVLAERSLDLLTALIAIFKAGGVYLPLDPQHPTPRLRQILQHSGSQFVLTAMQFVPTLTDILADQPTSTYPRIIPLDDLLLHGYSHENLPTQITPEHLAYIIYTSGSTGTPKGAMVGQKGMLNHLYAKITDLQLTSDDTVAQTASQCFDISIWQFLAALLVGGRVEILPDEIAHDPDALLREVEQRQVSILETVPSLLRAMLDVQEMAETQRPKLKALRWLIPTGEALPVDLCQRWLQLYPQIPLLNAYGPTECSDDVTHHPIYEVPDETVSSVPIGRAVHNMRLYVLDRLLMPVPIGVSGELYVGGVGVGRGYLGDTQRTAEVFVPDPFSLEEGARLYKTGDLVRYLPDGTLEFLGRIDYQVKLRGYRIELGEIEAILRQHPAVRDVVVLVREDLPGEKRLVAYAVGAYAYTEANLSSEQLRHFLKEKLPEYMVPSAFVMLESLPLTSNGKLDYRALPIPNGTYSLREVPFESPRNSIEEKLASIWADVLGLERVSIHDDFFDLGGHSLLSVRLTTQIRQQFGQHMPLSAIFQGRTIATLAEMLRQHSEGSPWTPEAEVYQPHVDLQTEAVLDLTTCPEVWPDEINTEPANIFLTGATGFLGTFLLHDLLQQTSADIYCLVRSSNAEEGQKKLQRALEAAFLWQPEYKARIMPVIGDLEQQFFGLSTAAFKQLARRIDVIYHNGALVNAIYPYHALKAANVLGTQEVLRLATQDKIKPLHYISTLSVFSHKKAASGRPIRESDSLDDHREHIHGGYAQSKWAAEKLVTIARSRGLPVVIYRPGRITGHSQSGAWRIDDVLCRMLKGCIQLGSIPGQDTVEMMEMTPVDYVSQAIVSLSRRKASFGQAFHLFNPFKVSVSDLVSWINDFGYPLQQVTYDTWLEDLKQTAEQSASNALADLVPLFPKRKAEEKQPAQLPQVIFDNRNALVGLSGTPISCSPVDDRLLHTYLSYLVQSGFLHAPQLEKETESPSSKHKELQKSSPCSSHSKKNTLATA